MIEEEKIEDAANRNGISAKLMLGDYKLFKTGFEDGYRTGFEEGYESNTINDELRKVAEKARFIFSNGVNYPEGTIGYQLSQDANAILKKILKLKV